MGWTPIWHPRWLPKLENIKILQLWLYLNNDGRRFFSGSVRPALWVFILKMNTLLDIKIQQAICGWTFCLWSYFERYLRYNMRKFIILLQFCTLRNLKKKKKKKKKKIHLRYILFSVVEQWLSSCIQFTVVTSKMNVNQKPRHYQANLLLHWNITAPI